MFTNQNKKYRHFFKRSVCVLFLASPVVTYSDFITMFILTTPTLRLQM